MPVLILVLKLSNLLYNGIWVKKSFMQRAPVFIMFFFFFGEEKNNSFNSFMTEAVII